jgi:hypothetical protein
MEEATASKLRTDVGHIDVSHVDKFDTKISPENVITEFDKPVYPEYDATVLGTTYRAPKNILTRATRKMGKMMGVIPRNVTYKALDFDLNLLKGTCLENIALTDLDVSIIKIIIRDYMLIFHNNPIEIRSKIINEGIPVYCEFRNLMTNRDTYFLEKYPNIAYKFLKSVIQHVMVDENPIELRNELTDVIHMTNTQLKDYNLSTNLQNRFINLMNSTFYTEGQGSEYLGKTRGGKTRVGKRRIRRCKKRRTKHNRRYKK